MRISIECPLVLGSASPRRRELLAVARIPFVARPADVDETGRQGEDPNAYLDRVTLAKLAAVRSAVGAAPSPILVADTVVTTQDREILGKPANDEAGRAMLARLSGKTHAVHTRFLLAARGDDAPVDNAPVDNAPVHAQTVVTQVTFRRLAVGEAEAYVDTGEGRDKAGGYAVQGGAAAFVERIEGSYANVVGLPLCELVVALRSLGWFGVP